MSNGFFAVFSFYIRQQFCDRSILKKLISWERCELLEKRMSCENSFRNLPKLLSQLIYKSKRLYRHYFFNVGVSFPKSGFQI